jgi:hypothetical protein
MDSSSDSSRSSSGGDIDLVQLVRDLHVIAPPQASPSPETDPETDVDDVDHSMDDQIAADESPMSEIVSWVASSLALESDNFYTRKVGCFQIEVDTTMDVVNAHQLTGQSYPSCLLLFRTVHWRSNWSEVNATTLGSDLASFAEPMTDENFDEANPAERLDAIMDDRLSTEDESLAPWALNPRSPNPDSGSLIEVVNNDNRIQVLVWPPLTDNEISDMTANSGLPAKQVKLENFAVQLILGGV